MEQRKQSRMPQETARQIWMTAEMQIFKSKVDNLHPSMKMTTPPFVVQVFSVFNAL